MSHTTVTVGYLPNDEVSQFWIDDMMNQLTVKDFAKLHS